MIMKRLENLKIALLGLSFVFWFITSFVNPIMNLFNEPNTYEYIVGFNLFVVLGYFATTIIPKAFKKNTLESLNLKPGSTKKAGGCSSCKKKK